MKARKIILTIATIVSVTGYTGANILPSINGNIENAKNINHETKKIANDVSAKIKNISDSKNNKPSNKTSLEKCIDGDTANFTSIGKTRFLLIDTPESTNKIEPYGKVASKYTCDQLTKAKSITYEYDGNTKDRYNRTLAYIFVDGELLQKKIAQQGFVKKFYLYKKNYKYEDVIRKSINDKYNIYKEMRK